MTHTVHVMTSNTQEAYIMVLKNKKTKDALLSEAFHGTAHIQKKNGPRLRFVRDHCKHLSVEHHVSPVELTTHDDVMDYRAKITDQYLSDGYIVLDDKHYETMDKPADKNFGEVTKRVDISELLKTHDQKDLIADRKKLTVGEFLAKYS